MSRGLQSIVASALVCTALAIASTAALGSSDGRTFEQVSPLYKGGGGVGLIEAVGENGESVAYFAPGAFAGAPTGLTQNLDTFDYLSRREAAGWSTVPVEPPATSIPVVIGGNRDVSPDMSVTLALGEVGRNSESAEQEGARAEFLLHDTNSPDTDANWVLVGKALELLDGRPMRLRYLGASRDFCHLLFDEFSTEVTLVGPEVLLAGAENANEQMYEMATGCGGGAVALRMVGVNNDGALISPGCRSDLGIEGFGEHSKALQAYNAISADGETVIFTTCIENDKTKHQLFARLGQSHTIEISKPLAEPGDPCAEMIPCPNAAGRANAEFAGASENGATVFFTTTARLDETTDTDTGNDLYMARIGCPSGLRCQPSERGVTQLVQASHDPNGGEAQVQGVVRVAPDASRVYFVARGDLLSSAEQAMLEVEGAAAPAAGSDNLYEYDAASGVVEFVAELCSGYHVSGAREDRRCPSVSGEDTRMWLLPSGEPEAQTAGADGRYLFFTSYGQLTSDDTDTSSDAYRFDAATDQLERISIGEDGFDANGNDEGGSGVAILPGTLGGSVRSQGQMIVRAIDEQGSRIVFESAEPLSPGATNGLLNAYEWREGRGGGEVSLLSGGTSSTPVQDAVMSPDGRDVFFSTSQGLVPQDTDGAPDIYDARLGGGFPLVPASPEPCSGDACQGPLTNPASLLVPASESQPAGENASPLPPRRTVSKKTKTKCKRGYMRGKRGKCVRATKAQARKASGRRRDRRSSKGGERS